VEVLAWHTDLYDQRDKIPFGGLPTSSGSIWHRQERGARRRQKSGIDGAGPLAKINMVLHQPAPAGKSELFGTGKLKTVRYRLHLA